MLTLDLIWTMFFGRGGCCFCFFWFPGPGPKSKISRQLPEPSHPWACDSVWEAFAASGPPVAEKEKAELLKAKLKQWVRTKPGAMKVMKKKAKAMKKRTVFTVPFAGTKIFNVKKRKAMK